MNELVAWTTFPALKHVEVSGKGGYADVTPLGLTGCASPTRTLALRFMWYSFAWGHRTDQRVEALGEWWCQAPSFGYGMLSFLEPYLPFFGPNRLTGAWPNINKILINDEFGMAPSASLSGFEPFWEVLTGEIVPQVRRLSFAMVGINQLLHDQFYPLLDKTLTDAVPDINRALAQIHPMLSIDGIASYLSFSIASIDLVKKTVLLHFEPVGLATRFQIKPNGELKVTTALGVRAVGNVLVSATDVKSQLSFMIRAGTETATLAESYTKQANDILSNALTTALTSILPPKLDLLLTAGTAR